MGPEAPLGGLFLLLGNHGKLSLAQEVDKQPPRIAGLEVQDMVRQCHKGQPFGFRRADEIGLDRLGIEL
jgi:hypothetical protein